MTVAMFQLGGALAPSLPELEIGPWTRSPPEIAAFDASTDQPASLWRIDLARDDAASRAALAGGERSVANTHAVLDDVPRRLERALAEFERVARPGRAPEDHSRAPAPELPRAEADLVAALVRAEPRAPEQPGRPGRLERALHSIADLARGRARVETHLEGVLVACSVTTLSGDTELWIVAGLSAAGAALHARSVDVALRTRHAWTRLLAMIVAWSGRFAALGMLSAGVAALPLVWSFLRDLLREVRTPAATPSAA